MWSAVVRRAKRNQLCNRLREVWQAPASRPRGINCLRRFPLSGIVAWGARTLAGDDRLASEFKYIPVRRMAMYIEESVIRSVKWAVLESNAEPLWAQLRLNIGAFMHELF